ncbi:hypothetical protein J3459_007835 [Metarhizium acridum]|nr:hypothetical protein J3459_007835 [Metarhizium acridum]
MASTSNSLLRRQVIQCLPRASQTLRPLAGISKSQSFHNSGQHQARNITSYDSLSLKRSQARRFAVASKGTQHWAELRPAVPTASYPAQVRQFSAAHPAETRQRYYISPCPETLE